MTQNHKLLRIEDLVLYFKTTHGPVQAVDGVNFELGTNRAVVILGDAAAALGRSGTGRAGLRRAAGWWCPRGRAPAPPGPSTRPGPDRRVTRFP